MMRIMWLSLLVLCFSVACMGQTFQYSRGWTNGKRASNALNSGAVTHSHRDEETLTDVVEAADSDRKLERCLLQLQNFLRNPLSLRAGVLTLNPSNNNNNNNIFGMRHQANDLYEELNGAETSDYVKH